MNKPENISDKPSRSIWFWCGGTLALLILLTAIAMPCVLNYRAIKYVELHRGTVDTEPCTMFKALPDSWQEWLRRSLGDRIQSIETVTVIYWDASSIKDDDLRCLERFTNLSRLYINKTQISDAGLIHLKGLTNLNHLDISGTLISDDGLIHLNGLTNLTTLINHNTLIGDEGLSHLKGLKNLTWLDVSYTEITDKGLIHLKGFTKLYDLNVSNTQVSKEGFSYLQTALPDCEIRYTSASP